jgi:hypothetical protein
LLKESLPEGACLLYTSWLTADGLGGGIAVGPRGGGKHQSVVTQNLLVAQQQAVSELQALEDLESFGHTEFESLPVVVHVEGTPTAGSESTSPNQNSRIMDGSFSPLLSLLPKEMCEGRFSVLLNKVILGGLTKAHLLPRMKTLWNPHMPAQPVHLLRKWTDQGDRLSKLISNSDEDGMGENFSSGHSDGGRSGTGFGTMSLAETSDYMSENSGFLAFMADLNVTTLHLETTSSYLQDLKSPSSSISNAKKYLFSNQSVSATSATPSKFPARLDIRVSTDNPGYIVLPMVLKDYGVHGNTSQYSLRIIYRDKHQDQERTLRTRIGHCVYSNSLRRKERNLCLRSESECYRCRKWHEIIEI